MKRLIYSILFLLLASNLNAQDMIGKANLHAHSHNDYLKTTPLWDALYYGATSIEVDVFAHQNELKVAHVKFALGIRKTLSKMYLDPIQQYINEFGFIYKDTTLVLMIDFKTPSDSTLPILLQTIKPYQSILSYTYNDSVIKKDIQLVISGAGFSYDQIKDLDTCYVFLDGSVHACENNMPYQFIPRGSANYASIFKWKGNKQMPDKELVILRDMVEKAKACNKKLRFYNMPEKITIWKTFLDEGVDWINTDNMNLFVQFYEAYQNGEYD